MNDEDENDPIQQQYDTIVMEMDQLQERMDWAVRSGYDETGGTTDAAMTTNTTSEGMDE